MSAAVAGGADAIGAMEAAAAERLSADDASGALASLVVENASLMQRFQLSQQPLSGLRCACFSPTVHVLGLLCGSALACRIYL